MSHDNYRAMSLLAFLKKANKPQFETLLKAVCEFCELDMEKGPWLAGGSLRRLYIGEKYSNKFDFDIFSVGDPISSYEKILTKIKNTQGRQTKDSEYAETFQVKILDTPVTLQLVKYSFGYSFEKVIDTFDYTPVQLITDGKYVGYSLQALSDNKVKKLGINRWDKVHTNWFGFCRYMKFYKAGYRMSTKDQTKFVQLISESKVDSKQIFDLWP